MEDTKVLLRLQNPMSTRKNFFEMYKQLQHAPSNRFANTALDRAVTATVFCYNHQQ